MGEYDEFGLPLESDPYAAPATSTSAPADAASADSFADVIINGQNKMAELWLGLFDTVENVGTGAQDTIGEVAEEAAGVVTGAQQTIGGVAERVTNPLNLAGLGFGLSVGGIGTIVGVGLAAGFAADQVFFGGTGTAGLVKRFAGSRRR
ncbi:MAG TPA: hypothetical protein VD970_03575 [Acetobacteraceae bacterium]|nr:hypothetical protein [Acetobacteraceae bacterium]